jgi:hypothetical protein
MDPSVTEDYGVKDTGNFISFVWCDSCRNLVTQITPDLRRLPTLTLGFELLQGLSYFIKVKMCSHQWQLLAAIYSYYSN